VVITARRQGVVGLAEGRVRGRTLVLDRLVVDAACRSEGIGSHLLAAVCSHAAEQDCTLVWALVPAGSRAAGFLEGRGFVSERSLPAWQGGRDYVSMGRRVT
jgi:N-acetylglutamate synthase-like GNAT family acetyltransferase